MLKELRTLWEKCREARDNLDKDILERDTFHADICACEDCETCRDFFDLPWWQFYTALLLWGAP